MILKISLRAKGGVPKTLLEQKHRLNFLYFPQNTLMLTESREEFSDLHSIFRLRALRYSRTETPVATHTTPHVLRETQMKTLQARQVNLSRLRCSLGRFADQQFDPQTRTSVRNIFFDAIRVSLLEPPRNRRILQRSLNDNDFEKER